MSEGRCGTVNGALGLAQSRSSQGQGAGWAAVAPCAQCRWAGADCEDPIHLGTCQQGWLTGARESCGPCEGC